MLSVITEALKGDKGEKREKTGEEKEKSEVTSPPTETTEKKEKLDQSSDVKKGECYNATLYFLAFCMFHSGIEKNKNHLIKGVCTVCHKN